MTLLLLEHLNEITHGQMHTEIEDAKNYILQEANLAEFRLHPSIVG